MVMAMVSVAPSALGRVPTPAYSCQALQSSAKASRPGHARWCRASSSASFALGAGSVPPFIHAGSSSSMPLFLSARARKGCPVTMPMIARSLVTASAVSAPVEKTENPLLSSSALPLFDKIQAEHVVPGMKSILADVAQTFSTLEANVEPTWPGLVEPLERLSDKLEVAWGAVNHLKSVKDSEALRKAVEEIQPEVVALSLKLGQSKPVYDAFRSIREGALWDSLSTAQKRVVQAEMESAETSGVALEGEAKARFNEIQQELTQLATKFSNNVLDATKKFSRLVTDPAEVEGLPPTALSLAAQQAAAKGHEGATAEAGPWLFTLDIPSYLPVMQHCKNRALREEVYRGYLTRASDGELDNAPIILRLLQLRQEKAKLLGYENHAQVVLLRRMATLDAAEKLVDDLREAAWDSSVKELDELKAFAKENGAEEAAELKHWDIAFWSERLREAKYDLRDEELRPYFSFPSVLEGLFALATRLFRVKIEAANGEAPVWQPDVLFFRVTDLSGAPVAYFYLDPYTRPEEKRGGAWMDTVIGRSRLFAPEGASSRLPVAHMVCNQTPPVGDAPSLMTFREVETLFHEFGHALQHMLTQQDEGMVAGIRNVEWDAVELPSQFMENWCYHRETLLGIAKHYQTGEALPDEMYQKIVNARNFRAASQTMRQLHFSSIDLALHSVFDPSSNESVFEFNQKVAARFLAMPQLSEDRFLCSFSHIFSGGYAAGYYGYKWAEVLSADAFSAFEEAGLEDDTAIASVGQRFRDTVLALGGGKAASDVFVDFRGHEPSIEPLLRHSGLITEPVLA